MRLPESHSAGAAPLRYRDPIFTSVVKTADITYGSAVNLSGHAVTLKLDVYAPPATDTITSRPAIVWVHGGSFSGGDKTSPELVDESNTFAKEGYVNASINYRLARGRLRHRWKRGEWRARRSVAVGVAHRQQDRRG